MTITLLTFFLSGNIYRRGAKRWRKIHIVNGHSFVAKRFSRVSWKNSSDHSDFRISFSNASNNDLSYKACHMLLVNLSIILFKYCS